MNAAVTDQDTSFLDNLIQWAATEAAVADGRPLGWIAHRYGVSAAFAAVAEQSSYAVRHSGNIWTDDELDYLTQNAGVLGDAQIAAALGRSTVAIDVKRSRLGLPAPSRNNIYFTAQRAGAALGIDGKGIIRLMRLGQMPSEKAPVKEREIFRIERTQFYRWAVNPMNWPYFINSVQDTTRITDPHLRALIERQKVRWEDEWWTTQQAAEYHGVDHRDVYRYIRVGIIKGVRYQNWMVLRSDITNPDLRFYKGDGANARAQMGRYGTPAGDAFIILARAVGLSYPTIERMSKRPRSVYMRISSLVRNGNIPHLVRAFGLQIHVRYPEALSTKVRAADVTLYADWRLYRHRFPALAAACERFAAGERLTTNERVLVNGALFAAARWRYGDDDEMVRPMTQGGNRLSLSAATKAWQRMGGSWEAVVGGVDA